MKSKLLLAIFAVAVLASGAWAQLNTPRAMAMGGVGIAVADDAAAWVQNPAGLAALNVPVREGSAYGNDLIASYAETEGGDQSAWGLTWSGWKPSEKFGFGAGLADLEDVATLYGVGFGVGLKSAPLSFGLNLAVLNPEAGDSETLLNLGALWSAKIGETENALRVGLLAADVTEEAGNMTWNLGLAWKAMPNLLLAVDAIDLTEENGDVSLNAGLEYHFGANNEWAVRVGGYDTGDDYNLTAGIGYRSKNWRVDFGWMDADPDSIWSLGVGVNL